MRSPAFPLEGDTVAAVSTPYGVGGIGIVRMSGPDAETIALRIFHSKRQKPPFQSHRLYYGHVRDPKDGTLVDEVLMTVMCAPHTYTRENMVEIQCHGGSFPVRKILELLLAEGVRLAESGEFTRRAFLNGRIDLVQAEAVLDTVEAKSETALRFAQRQLDGTLSREIQSIRDRIKGLLVDVEAWLDFPEEEVPGPEFSVMHSAIDELKKDIRKLTDTYREGHLYRDGVTVVIGGSPNVGKSTLLNVLVGRDRAIVSAVPGTTRDFLEEPLLLDGIPVRLIDTAGLHDTQEEVERKGIAFARHQIGSADLFLWVLDASRLGDENVGRIFDVVPDERTVIVLNKMDLAEEALLDKDTRGLPPFPCVRISALYEKGIDSLKETMFAHLTSGSMDLDSRAVLTNLRHRTALEKSFTALERAMEQIDSPGWLGDLLAADLRHALRELAVILGETTSEEILHDIFDTFCIGK